MRAGRPLAVMWSSVKRAARGVLLGMSCVALAACNEADESASMPIVSVKAPETLPDWLTPKEKIEPAVWLRSREVGHEVLPSDPESTGFAAPCINRRSGSTKTSG